MQRYTIFDNHRLLFSCHQSSQGEAALLAYLVERPRGVAMYDVGKHGWMPDGKPGSMKRVAHTEFAGGTRDYSENVVAKIFTLYLAARIPSQQEMVALYEFGCLDASLRDDVA